MAAETRLKASKLGIGVALLAAVVGIGVFAGVRFLFFGLDEATPWDKPARVVDDSRIELTYEGRECRDRVEVDVEESSDLVVITVTETVRSVVCGDDELASYDASVDLEDPLGERELVDGACRLGQFSEDQRCERDAVTTGITTGR